ncbi:hypothetical protein [Polynucleobacter sp.]|uniref:hypothetical protein n=1 Tax=Polynucleobacter sp. TaxID=2029855 RepID=UPI003F6A0BDA
MAKRRSTGGSPTYQRIKQDMPNYISAMKMFADTFGLDYKKLRVVVGLFGEVTFKVEFADKEFVASTNGPATRQAAAFEANAGYFGLKTEWLGKNVTFPSQGTYKIVGLNTKAKKNKILLENMNGRGATCTAPVLKRLMEAQAA